MTSSNGYSTDHWDIPLIIGFQSENIPWIQFGIELASSPWILCNLIFQSSLPCRPSSKVLLEVHRGYGYGLWLESYFLTNLTLFLCNFKKWEWFSNNVLIYIWYLRVDSSYRNKITRSTNFRLFQSHTSINMFFGGIRNNYILKSQTNYNSI